MQQTKSLNKDFVKTKPVNQIVDYDKQFLIELSTDY